MGIIDTHAHLYCEDFSTDLQDVIKKAIDASVEKIFLPNIDETSINPILSLCAEFPGFFYPMIGLHPTDLTADYKKILDRMEQLLEQKNTFIGVGEVGLDYYWDRTFYREQQEAFEHQINWSLKYGLPLMIHTRSAHKELIDILKPYKSKGVRGVFHCFDGSEAEAKELLTFDGFMLGINGIVTFKKSSLPEILKKTVPLTRLVTETDAPYLAPTPMRGKRNESAYITYTIKKLSEIYGLSIDQITEKTRQNALTVFSKAIKSA